MVFARFIFLQKRLTYIAFYQSNGRVAEYFNAGSGELKAVLCLPSVDASPPETGCFHSFVFYACVIQASYVFA